MCASAVIELHASSPGEYLVCSTELPIPVLSSAAYLV
jgi:hypothetical protein